VHACKAAEVRRASFNAGISHTLCALLNMLQNDFVSFLMCMSKLSWSSLSAVTSHTLIYLPKAYSASRLFPLTGFVSLFYLLLKKHTRHAQAS